MRYLVILFVSFLLLNASEHFYYHQNKKITLTPIKQRNMHQPNTGRTIHYFKTKSGRLIGINNEILIKLKHGKTIENLLQKYPLTLKKQLTPDLYLCKVNSTNDTLTISSQLRREENVNYAQPNFIKRFQKR